MTPHVHVGAVDFLKTFCYFLLAMFIWRMVTAHVARKHPEVAAGMGAVFS